MRKTFFHFTLVLALGFTSLHAAFAQKKTFTVQASQVQAPIQPTMWGLFFEDINLGADGGVYAELVKNRSFEFENPMMGWRERKQDQAEGSLLVHNRGTAHGANPRYLQVSVTKEGRYGLSNEGFRGMGIKKDGQYTFSVLARQPQGSHLALQIELLNARGEQLGTASLSPAGSEWKKYEVSIKANATEPKAQLYIWAQGTGTLDLDMLSLFPRDTWKGRPGGMRTDLVTLLADMKPGFLRFPGGCIVEGRTLAQRYQWKKTFGPVENREMIVNRWNTEFRHRPTPDYFQTFGLGFFEYFQLSEDIGAAPLPILNCGMACQYNTGELVPLDQLQPFIQDALDLIEFANGPVESPFGQVRAQMGHPAPFNLKYLGVGNEQWGPQYIERYRIFEKAIKARYPHIQLISSVGPSAEGKEFDYLNATLREMKADILDEHYYKSPDWFFQNAKRYDNYDRKGPKIFAGEYAAQSVGIASPDNKNSWLCALSEAAFMTGLERNAEVVHMASYAPLFAHAEGWQWTPDLIWFDNLKAYGTPNYYVQKLFSTNRGTHVVPVLLHNQAVTGQDGCYASAAIDQSTREVILKVVNAADKPQEAEFVIGGVKRLLAKGTVQVLKSDMLDEVNTFENATAVSPVKREIQVKDKKIKMTLAPYSFQVFRVKIAG